MQEAAEAVAALDIAAGRWFELWRFGRLERESAVRAFAVVVLDVGAQDPLEVASADDQKPVEAFRAHGADEALSVGVRLRRSHSRTHAPDGFVVQPAKWTRRLSSSMKKST